MQLNLPYLHLRTEDLVMPFSPTLVAGKAFLFDPDDAG